MPKLQLDPSLSKKLIGILRGSDTSCTCSVCKELVAKTKDWKCTDCGYAGRPVACDCACYDEYALSCTPKTPGPGCSHGALTCPICSDYQESCTERINAVVTHLNTLQLEPKVRQHLDEYLFLSGCGCVECGKEVTKEMPWACDDCGFNGAPMAAECACYDTWSTYCTPSKPGPGCNHGDIYCPVCFNGNDEGAERIVDLLETLESVRVVQSGS